MLSCGRRSRPLHPERLDSVLSHLAFHRGRGLWHLIKTPWGFQNFSIGLHFRPQCQVLGGLFLQASFRDHVVRLDHVISLRLLTDSRSMGPKLPQELGLSLAHPPGTTSCSSQSHHHPHTPCRSSELGEAFLSISPDQMFSDLPVRSQHQGKCAVILDFTQ